MPIDYFAEINLAGFYHLTENLGGVTVCLNHPSTTTSPAPTSRPGSRLSMPRRFGVRPAAARPQERRLTARTASRRS